MRIKLVLSMLLLVYSASFSAAEGNSETGAETAAEGESAEKSMVVEVPLEPRALRNDRLIAKRLESGEAKWLRVGDTEFLGIFNADSTGKALGSVLILPEANKSPNAPGAINHLSINLARVGWHTLSISLPTPDFSGPAPKFPDEVSKQEISNESTAEESAEPTEATGDAVKHQTSADSAQALPEPKKWFADQQTKNMESLMLRILAAEAELKAYGGRYVILAQGVTAELILELISSKVIKATGLITLDISHPINQRSSIIAKNMALITLPTLDIFHQTGSKAAQKRKMAQRSNLYQQLYIPASGNDYRGAETMLFSRIKGWLKKNYSKE